MADTQREYALISEYQARIKQVGKYAYVSSALVLKPESDASHYHLIYATRNLLGLEKFKSAESSALRLMEDRRLQLQERKRHPDQFTILPVSELYGDEYIRLVRNLAHSQAQQDLFDLLKKQRRVPYDQVVAQLLQRPFVFEADVKRIIKDREGSVLTVLNKSSQSVSLKLRAGLIIERI